MEFPPSRTWDVPLFSDSVGGASFTDDDQSPQGDRVASPTDDDRPEATAFLRAPPTGDGATHGFLQR
eukprot:6141523-Lingulodinium_polyedra.AAC.1